MDFQQGSVWRKWDLHCHTPLSHLNSQYNCSFADVAKKIKDEDIRVIGITNYFIVLETEFKQLTECLGPGYYVIPNFEFRINDKNKDGEFINVHVLFNLENTTFTRIYESLARVRLINLSESTAQYCTYENIIKYGAETITVSFDELIEQLKKDFQILDDFVIVGVANGYGSFRPDAKPRNVELALKMDKSSHLIFGREQDVSFYLNIEGSRKNEIPFPKSVILASDARTISEIGKKITWVKADLTYLGLKQVIFEPAERVRIQNENPDNDFDKPVFVSVQITEPIKVLNDGFSKLSFKESKLALNRNMVSIIGGRGQGKSMLINYLGYALGGEVNAKLSPRIMLSDSYVVEWKQGSETSIKTYTLGHRQQIPFTFIYQSKVKEISDDPELLKSEIIQMLKGAGFEKPQSDIDELKVKECLQSYWSLKEWLIQKNEKGELINEESVIQEKIQAIESNIALATEGSNKDLLERYVKNISLIEEKRDGLVKLRELRRLLIEAITVLNSKFIEFEDAIKPIEILDQRKSIVNAYRKLLKSIAEFEQNNIEIKENNFKEYKGDLTQLLFNLTSFQKEISELNGKLLEIKRVQQDLVSTKAKLNYYMEEQKKYLNQEAKEITDTWENKIFNSSHRGDKENELIGKILMGRGINIKGTLNFNLSAFFQNADKFIDGRSLRPKSRVKVAELLQLEVSTIYDDLLNYTVEKAESICNEDPGCFYSAEQNDIFKLFVDPAFRNTYMYVAPLITVNGKLLNELSAGQKGTVYLCLKLATQLFSGPIIFDQPEDDLDNEFITQELIQLFKEIKKFRQVIIISHNANLVVNSDSEQVIGVHTKLSHCQIIANFGKTNQYDSKG